MTTRYFEHRPDEKRPATKAGQTMKQYLSLSILAMELYCGAGLLPVSYWLLNHNSLLVLTTKVFMLRCEQLAPQQMRESPQT
ncbi:hypothetical protein KTK71_004517 [Salmonella enterica]|nr:hypothetical protein [Salmonella enterica]EGX5147331.1 hypothetical protein [Salmonella enterica]EHQ9355015.1 hypothetical protein [Salmonella enterica]EHR1671008.1 hypothetical protein [Salmonella enterica]EHR8097472.1 hypothetical protein [Salmonella enterica]